MSSIKFDSIFKAVADTPEEASELQTRGDLMIALRDIIDDNEWTQAEAAEVFGLTQPRVSDLKNGKIEKFSIDLLMTCLYRAGWRFQPRYENHQLTMNVQSIS